MGADQSSTGSSGQRRRSSSGRRSSLRKNANPYRDHLKKNEKRLKVLLLGSGESGKTTVMRQLKLQNNKLTESERKAFISILRNNILTVARLVYIASKAFDFKLGDATKAAGDKILDNKISAENATAEVWQHVRTLWSDEGFKKAFERGSQHGEEFYVHDSSLYYFENIDRITATSFVPTDDDVLRGRVISVGLQTFDMNVHGYRVTFIDVGGQKNERKKWIHQFDDVSAVIYLISLSEFDQKMREDDSTMRVQDSLQLFESTVNLEYFSDTPIFLIFNKADLFKEKLKTSDMKIGWTEYTGPNEYDAAIKYVEEQYLKRNQHPDRPVKPFVTSAVNHDDMAKLFARLDAEVKRNGSPARKASASG